MPDTLRYVVKIQVSSLGCDFCTRLWHLYRVVTSVWGCDFFTGLWLLYWVVTSVWGCVFFCDFCTGLCLRNGVVTSVEVWLDSIGGCEGWNGVGECKMVIAWWRFLVYHNWSMNLEKEVRIHVDVPHLTYNFSLSQDYVSEKFEKTWTSVCKTSWTFGVETLESFLGKELGWRPASARNSNLTELSHWAPVCGTLRYRLRWWCSWSLVAGVCNGWLWMFRLSWLILSVGAREIPGRARP